jgi:hypothetical protein
VSDHSEKSIPPATALDVMSLYAKIGVLAPEDRDGGSG